jgi:uncharacterized lipoprotein YbaY
MSRQRSPSWSPYRERGTVPPGTAMQRWLVQISTLDAPRRIDQARSNPALHLQSRHRDIV